MRLLFVLTLALLYLPLGRLGASLTDRLCSKNFTSSFTFEVLGYSVLASYFCSPAARSSSEVKSTDNTSSASSEDPSLDCSPWPDWLFLSDYSLLPLSLASSGARA